MLAGGNAQYAWLGATHMLTGYDHLLFLFGGVFFLRGTKDILKFVSAFTLGHSLTLIAATLLGITASYYLVDAVIALSVLYKGFDYNGGFKSYFGVNAPNLLWMVLVSGLIHGFALATRLQQLPLGTDRAAIISHIVAFNIGVELGQVAALVVMVFLLSLLRRAKAFDRIARISNDGLTAAGVLLFLMQMHGYLHVTNPGEFGFERGLPRAHA